ncbi:PREDICTED: probable disease resistance protein At5g66900 isoform X1 [Brassica oleracea var. oleracea]|uniref:probable disease resistance protein At5g66900 isoform X1 n=1 Tax=Brassica oleracea var. oleracea TaxID=109376 RepID=UPI0006A6D0E4|nr:PREDICTED: probable disease resistance protein At5g66900 isoform X1 [Brassica oleracea var. oleracea]
MNDWVSLGLGSIGGALVSGVLKLIIEEAKKYKSFKPLSKDLAETMERLLPLTKEIDSMQNELDLGSGELKKLMETIKKAYVLVLKLKDDDVWFFEKSKYAREIEDINKDMTKFCDITLQVLQYRNQLKLLNLGGNVVDMVYGLGKKIDGLSVPVPVFKDLCSVPKLNKAPVGFAWPLMELKKRLLDDAVVNLVVSAPPGCGKTTLATQLCHDADVKGHFKHILFNVVSSTPNFKVIVQNLLQHNGYYPPHTFDNDSQATVGLWTLLEKLREAGPILLVLDDVWRGAELLLQKFRINLPDYKILVTSRFDFPSFGYKYHLEPLGDGDARALLIQWASRPNNTSDKEYELLLQKIVKRCNGFPIVIEVVGVSLNGQTLTTWKGQVESWSQGETVLDIPSQPTVLECLQPSFNALVPNLKECFLDMGSFLEDQKIRASVIIDIWMELYGKSSSILCKKYLEDLASQNLLKLVPLGNETEDGFYNEFLVTQHDILRELAIRQSELKENLERKRLNLEIREDTFPDWCLNGPRHPVVNASMLSISTDDLFSSNWVEMEFPNVKALVLNLSSPDYALPSFIAGMTKLKVLTITNHGFYPARLRNFSCLSLLPNLKRIRLEKVSVTLLDIPRLQLASLKKLSLVMCSFGEVFYDSEEIDVSKALPSLQEIDIDYCYDLYELPYWVSEVVSLKTLSITNCNKLTVLPEAIGNLSKLEVLRVSSCINLSELPETTDKLSNLRFLDISHCLGLRKLPLKIGKLQKLKRISMRKCWRCELPDSVRDLEDLEVKCEEETRSMLWERLMPKMRNLIVHEEETEHNLNLLQMF